MGLLDGQTAPIIDTYQYPTTNATSTGYDANTLNATPNMQANTYTANDATSAGYNPNAQADAVTYQGGGYDANTVEDRLTGLLSKDSPYMQQARASSLRGMNSRGLANSSMAIGAGHSAAIAAGLPIASQDSNSVNQARQFGANALNTSNQFNANSQNNVNANNAGYENQALASNTAAQNQFSLSNQAAQNRSALDNANALNNASQFNAGLEQQTNLQNQAALNQASQYNATVANEFAIQNKNAIDQSAKDFANANNEASIQNASNNLKLLLANAEETLSNYGTDIQRKTALDQIASTLIQSGLTNGIFATSDGAANWISMIGDLYPDMGLSVVTNLSTEASGTVV